ncbi:MAG: hypothetical protein ACRC6E_07645, partial [Fusobacteriaceae bacterium]
MRMTIKNDGDLLLAHLCDYRDINKLKVLWTSKCNKAKFEKHKNGTVIRRRNKEKETQHGLSKSALHLIQNIKESATTMRIGLSSFDANYNNPSEKMKYEAIKIITFLDT